VEGKVLLGTFWNCVPWTDTRALSVDPDRARGHDLFRAKGWEIALICSEKVKRCLENAGVTGIRFKSIVHKE